ncbi:MAG TPA: NRDE family protein [Thermoanaerobaculia bacterium]|nr:NRDE family protein [Thermoanaerobaculia bacterium]
MCLIALAHGPRFVLAANRDEDYERATKTAHVWEDAPDVVGGRDALHGGSWLAVSRRGRFAAVTNLRGAARRSRSRGLLVSSFVKSDESPETFAANVAREAEHYAGFHLIVGEFGKTLVYVSAEEQPRVLEHGIYAFSNAPLGEHWPKVTIAIEKMQENPDVSELLRFLNTPRNSGRVEEEVFIAGDRYGTRASTVVIATMDEILFVEQNYSRGGMASSSTSFGSMAVGGGWTSRV